MGDLLADTHPRSFGPSPRQQSQTKEQCRLFNAANMAKGEDVDPRMMSVTPRIRYNTIGGINGPLVILDNVSKSMDVLLRTQD